MKFHLIYKMRGRTINMGGWHLKGSCWQNPFKVDKDGTREQILKKYEEWLVQQKDLMSLLHELKGKNLACWCKPMDCHGDILLRYVNSGVLK